MKFAGMTAEVKIRLMTFTIFLKYNRFRIRDDRVSFMCLFHSFSPKIDLSVHFDSFILENFVVLKRNVKLHLIFYSKNKNTNKYHSITIQTGIRNMFESREFRWENDWKSARDVHFFHFFFLEKSLPLKKNEKRYFTLYYKNRNTWQFHAFNNFGNMSENGKFGQPQLKTTYPGIQS